MLVQCEFFLAYSEWWYRRDQASIPRRMSSPFVHHRLEHPVGLADLDVARIFDVREIDQGIWKLVGFSSSIPEYLWVPDRPPNAGSELERIVTPHPEASMQSKNNGKLFMDSLFFGNIQAPQSDSLAVGSGFHDGDLLRLVSKNGSLIKFNCRFDFQGG
jgi:hypothetical protein